MSWSAPATFIVGQVLRALDMNNINTDLNFLYNGGMVPISDSGFITPAQASFDIQSIPATWAHLLIVAYLRGDTAAVQTSCAIRFNNDSAANYIYSNLQGSGVTASATNGTAQTSGQLNASGVAAASASAGVFSPVFAFIPAYRATNSKHSISLSGYSGSPMSCLDTTYWSGSATINRITVFPGTGNWDIGSRLTLYGVGIPT